MNEDRCEDRNGCFLYHPRLLFTKRMSGGSFMIQWVATGTTQKAAHMQHIIVHQSTSEYDTRIGYGEYCWVDKKCDSNNSAKCDFCETPVPESVITLIRIHNWER